MEGRRRDQNLVPPSLGATLAMLMGQERIHWYPITLTMKNPHPNNIAHSLIGVWKPGSYIYSLRVHFWAAKI